MWEKLEGEEDRGWLLEALTSGTLVCVTDGSYDRARSEHQRGRLDNILREVAEECERSIC